MNQMNVEKALTQTDRQRVMVLTLFCVLVLAVLALKSFNEGWFELGEPLEVTGEPTLVFFTLADGCECEMSVVNAAEAQLAGWSLAQAGKIPLLRVDFSRRPDLVKQYGVARAPALVLLDANGNVAWKQDLGLSDDAPLDIAQAEVQARQLLDTP